MKTKDKEYLIEEFTKYCNEKKLILKNTGSISTVLNFVPKEEGQEVSKYYIEEYLFKINTYSSTKRNHFANILNNILKNKEKQHLVVELLVSKEGSKKSDRYDATIKENLQYLKYNNDLYFKYVNRKNFIKNNIDLLEEAIIELNSRAKKEDFFDAVIALPDFLEDVGNLVVVKNIFDKHIGNKNKYNHLFEKITDIAEDFNLAEEVEKLEKITFAIDGFKIGALIKGTPIAPTQVAGALSSVTYHVNRNTISDLNIKEMKLDSSAQKNVLNIIYHGSTLNNEKVKLFTNHIVKNVITYLKTGKNEYSLQHEEISELIQDALIKASKENLQKELSTSTQSKAVRNKI